MKTRFADRWSALFSSSFLNSFFGLLLLLHAGWVPTHMAHAEFPSPGEGKSTKSPVFQQYCRTTPSQCQYHCVSYLNGRLVENTVDMSCFAPKQNWGSGQLEWEKSSASVTPSSSISSHGEALNAAGAVLVSQLMQMDSSIQNGEARAVLSAFKQRTLRSAETLAQNAGVRNAGLRDPNGFISSARKLGAGIRDATSPLSAKLEATSAGGGSARGASDPLRALGIGVSSESDSSSTERRRFERDLEFESGLIAARSQDSAANPERLQLAKEALSAARKFGTSESATGVTRGLIKEARQLRIESEFAQQTQAAAPLAARVQRFEQRDRVHSESLKSAEFTINAGAPLPAHAQRSVELAHLFQNESKTQFWSGLLGEGEALQKVGLELLDVALTLTPGVSVGKDAYELVTGKNLVTGERLSGFERGMAVVGILSLGTTETIHGIAKGVMRIGTRVGEELLPVVTQVLPEVLENAHAAKRLGFDILGMGEQLLKRSEDSGLGHTLERHIGKSEEFLRARLERLLKIRPDTRAVSTFDSIEEAGQVVERGLRTHARGIEEWLPLSKNSKYKIIVPFRGGKVLRVNENAIEVGNSATIVLKKDSEKGLYILTAFVE